MGEIKSVKVDNWGVFFLQKLQNFFNKTDFCDLTLQFGDNSQLKVHRLVLSACTDFFNVLEQTCELMDDALVMPAELQADVVVPIVNFMYTGTLEFELKMYAKLLRTAKEMNMTVLLKLLEAHKRTMETSRGAPNKVNQAMKNKRIPIKTIPKIVQPAQPVNFTHQSQQRIQITSHPGAPSKRVIMKPMQERIAYKPISNTVLRVPPKLQRGPIRFEEPNTQQDTYETSFDSISYESKPLKEEPEDYIEMQATTPWNRSSPFEQLRKGFNNNKRPAVATFTSPPAKKPNIEDVKEFSEQQRMRKQIAAEFGDDAEFDSIMDDEFHHDDDDEEPLNVNPSPSSSSVAVKQQQQQQQNQQTSIVIKQSPNEKPTIVVKDSSNSKMDHAKIISEVLRQYPHLVKSNKNIKLKIMPNVGGQTQKIIVKKETIDNMSAVLEQNNESEKQQSIQRLGSQKAQSIVKKPLKSYSTAVKVETQTKPATPTVLKDSNEVTTTNSSAPQKRRIDSKTMHALIALGAENTTGPWLCLRCGVNGRPISIPSYRGFRRHLINTHKQTIDSALCEYCGWRSGNNPELHYHMLTEHKVTSLLYTFPECKECNKLFLNKNDLQLHGEQYHPDSHKQQCIYCNKVFVKEMNLYTHMKTFHKRRAREDGVIDFSDEEMDDEHAQISGDAKIKILSDIALPSTLLKLEEHPKSDKEEEYANDSGPKFVNADGNEMLLTAEQREEIMSQLDQDHDGGVVMVLNESVFPPDQVAEVDVNDMKLKLEARDNTDEFADANSEFLSPADVELRGNEISTEENALESNKDDEDVTHEQHNSDNDERLDDDDHMEWAENLISAHDADDVEELDEDKDDNDDDDKHTDEETEKKSKAIETIKEEKISPAKSVKNETQDPKKAEDISLKLKMLTGDWTDDEIDEEYEENSPDISQQHKEKSQDGDSAISLVEYNAKKSKSDVIESKIQDEEVDEIQNETEIDANSSLTAEDEITQSSQSENLKEEDETKKEDGAHEEKLETTGKFENVVSEVDGSSPVVETKKQILSREERPSRRTSAVKDNDTKKNTTEDWSDSKDQCISVTRNENTDDEHVEEKEKEKPSKSTTAVEIKEEANSSYKSTEENPSKTPDKVTSLLNEWADEDDDL